MRKQSSLSKGAKNLIHKKNQNDVSDVNIFTLNYVYLFFIALSANLQRKFQALYNWLLK